jgi:hypothetical protein
MPPKQPTKEIVVIQELGNSAVEGSRKRRKSIVTERNGTLVNGETTSKGSAGNGDVRVNGGSPRVRKVNGGVNGNAGIGSRLVVGK